MTLCPIAVAVGCAKCPAFSMCPLKAVIGDQKKDDDAGSSAGAKGAAKPTGASSKKKP
jgi:hypothetical protein